MKLADNKKAVGRFYEKKYVARTYMKKRFESPVEMALHKNQVREVNRLMKENCISNVLEIAPGTGRLTSEIDAGGIALEKSDEMISELRKTLSDSGKSDRWMIKKGDAFRTGLKRSSVPAIITFRLIRHFRKNDRKRLYMEFSRILEDSGMLIFDVPNEKTEKMIRSRNPGKYQVYDELYTKKMFMHEMKSSGFEVISMKGNVKFFLFQAAVGKILFFAPSIASFIIRVIDRLPVETENPFEWVVLCRKK